MKTPEQVTQFVQGLLREGARDFRPCAFFDERLDCIRVVARDCSITETRLNALVTLLEDTYYPASGNKRYVGFTIKGARHFCKQHSIPVSRAVKITEILDMIVASFPELIIQMFVDGIAKPLVEEEKIEEVELAPAA